ncbi:MAG: hypothetical protein IJ743_02660 [Bacilli bacterium]|nr:hypothetical protein [Bacilli bacterium]
MEKYSDELLKAYVNGYEIEESVLEKLEDDNNFMLRVFLLTNDFRMYYFCSERLKHDYAFVKTIIMKFVSNIPFICEVAENYLESPKDELSRIELIILMCEYTKNTTENWKYLLRKEVIYNIKRGEIERARIENEDNGLFEGAGKGFYFIYDEFSKSEIILIEVATKMLDEILEEDKGDIEELLHRTFFRPDQINSNTMNEFMLRHIHCFDSMLASYLKNHKFLMKKFENKLQEMIKRWYRYEWMEERKIYEELLEKVHEYFSIIKNKTIFSETGMVYYIARKLGIEDKIVLYQGIGQDLLEEIKACQNDELYKSAINEDIQEKLYCKKITELMTSILKMNPTLTRK